ncbi:diguanylate cyclase [Bdellovibrionota bacterium]
MQTILIVDDEIEVVKALERTLRDMGKVLTATSGKAALDILEKEEVHVVLSDQRMPKMTGIELLTKVYEKYPQIVRIILTGFTDIKDLIEAINRARIYRYLTKPWENRELQMIVRQAMERYDLQEQNKSLLKDLQKQNEQLEAKEKELVQINLGLEETIDGRTREIRKMNLKLQKMAATDSLTKLGNRRFFTKRLEEELLRIERYQRPLSILVVDVDHFKHYNDLGGHLKGDQALRKISKILKENCRSVDTVARYGGEEFVLLLPETDKNGAMETAERLRRSIEETTFPFERKLPNQNLTVSIGVATAPTHCAPKNLLKKGDSALYKAKKKGRNCVVFSK